jgi:hypothetical protein
MINPKFLFLFFSWQPKNKIKIKIENNSFPMGGQPHSSTPRGFPGGPTNPGANVMVANYPQQSE